MSGLVLPHKISTLLYCFDERGRVLLMERAQEPNLGLWSPCGGKLDTAAGESSDRGDGGPPPTREAPAREMGKLLSLIW